MSIQRFAIFLLLTFLVFASPAPAAVFEDLARDFAPVSGYVVQPDEGGFLIDRSAADGIDVGDLFSVVQPGQKIVHPVTGKVLGTLDRVKGFLQVTRIRPGYSHTRSLGSTEQIRSGDVIRRYEQIPSLFLDQTGEGRPFYDRLRSVLPGLEWQYLEADGGGKAPSIPERTLLSFLFGPDTLEIRAPNTPVRTYNLSAEKEESGPAAMTPPVPAAPVERKTPESKKESNVLPIGSDFVTRGALPDGTWMADFALDGNRLLLAVTEGTRIEVFEVGDKPVSLATGGESRGGRILSLHWWRPQPGGPLLLAATIAAEENRSYNPAIGQTISGRVHALRGGTLEPVGDSFPYLVGSFDRDGDGSRETLLGQNFDRDIFFGSRIYELRLEGDGLGIGDPSFSISSPFPVQGALFADLTGDGREETIFVRNRVLFVYDGAKLLYESSRQMGGSYSVVTYDINPGAADRLFTTEAFEVPPTAVDLDGDGRLELVAIAFEGSPVSGIGADVRKSWLATLDYREGRFVRGTLGPELESPILGLYATRSGVFVVTTQSPSLFKPKKPSYLLFLSLAAGTGR